MEDGDHEIGGVTRGWLQGSNFKVSRDEIRETIWFQHQRRESASIYHHRYTILSVTKKSGKDERTLPLVLRSPSHIEIKTLPLSPPHLLAQGICTIVEDS